jgi:hypothetical protein
MLNTNRPNEKKNQPEVELLNLFISILEVSVQLEVGLLHTSQLGQVLGDLLL